MNTKAIICGAAIMALLMIAPQFVLAECSAGRIEVTIVTPHGIITICVPESAVDHIGGPNDVVIPAICPGFTQEEVEDEINNPLANMICERYNGSTSTTGDPCTYIECSDDSNLIFEALEGPEDEAEAGLCEFDFGGAMWNNFCYNNLTGYYSNEISEEEADACVAILNTFVED